MTPLELERKSIQEKNALQLKQDLERYFGRMCKRKEYKTLGIAMQNVKAGDYIFVCGDKIWT